MKKIILFLLFVSLSFADTYTTVKKLIGEEKFNTYKELIKSTFPNNKYSLEEILTQLEANGLINLFFQKPKTIHPTFIFKNNNPIFNTHTLYKTLDILGYYYFYPSKIENKNNIYKITIEMKSTHYIDPLNFLQKIRNYGCSVADIKKDEDFTYTIECQNEFIKAAPVTLITKAISNPKGVYWITPNGFKKIEIKSSKFDYWHPYIIFFDKHLNEISSIEKQNVQNSIIITTPPLCKYIKISDNFTKENIKRGIFVKGLK